MAARDSAIPCHSYTKTPSIGATSLSAGPDRPGISMFALAQNIHLRHLLT